MLKKRTSSIKLPNKRIKSPNRSDKPSIPSQRRKLRKTSGKKKNGGENSRWRSIEGDKKYSKNIKREILQLRSKTVKTKRLGWSTSKA